MLKNSHQKLSFLKFCYVLWLNLIRFVSYILFYQINIKQKRAFASPFHLTSLVRTKIYTKPINPRTIATSHDPVKAKKIPIEKITIPTPLSISPPIRDSWWTLVNLEALISFRSFLWPSLALPDGRQVWRRRQRRRIFFLFLLVC